MGSEYIKVIDCLHEINSDLGNIDPEIDDGFLDLHPLQVADMLDALPRDTN